MMNCICLFLDAESIPQTPMDHGWINTSKVAASCCQDRTFADRDFRGINEFDSSFLQLAHKENLDSPEKAI
jgi:hypothetical protein